MSPSEPAAHQHERSRPTDPTDDLLEGPGSDAPSVDTSGGANGYPRWLTTENLFVPVALIALSVTLALTAERFLSQANLINILVQMSILAIVSFGVTVVMIGGNFDLSVGSQVGLHSAVSAYVMLWTGSIWLGVLGGLLSGAIFGLFNGWLVAGLSINPFIATLGTLVMGRGLALAITGTRPVTGLPPEIARFGTERPLGLPAVVWLMLAIFVIAFYILHVSPLGLRIFATGGNREAARLAGIRTRGVILVSFVISGVFASVAGMAITARLRSGQPLAGSLLELFAVAAVVLGGSSLYGGRGSVPRTLMGVALIAIIANGLNLIGLSTPVQEIIIGLVFIAAASAEWFRTRGGGR
jgi:ribose/xylose/arabinose/galactoside ABC-type transport system permease subunit